MRRSLGIISGAFALRSQPFARDGHVVFLSFPLPLPLRRLRVVGLKGMKRLRVPGQCHHLVTGKVELEFHEETSARFAAGGRLIISKSLIVECSHVILGS
jgi:hypothetical protein